MNKSVELVVAKHLRDRLETALLFIINPGAWDDASQNKLVRDIRNTLEGAYPYLPHTLSELLVDGATTAFALVEDYDGDSNYLIAVRGIGDTVAFSFIDGDGKFRIASRWYNIDHPDVNFHNGNPIQWSVGTPEEDSDVIK
jgi:hypothetical protein